MKKSTPPLGQHFLRDQRIADNMLASVSLNDTSSVMEIGCGDGFLTRTILRHSIERLWCIEIDERWASYVQRSISDQRLTVKHQDFLKTNFAEFEPNAPWTVLSNLPYHVTFPILHLLQQHRSLIKEGAVMVQAEVADKIIKTTGRGFGYVSLFFQHYFEWRLLDTVPPEAFDPPPKIMSKTLHFKPIVHPQPIPHEERFWDHFIRCLFKQPRRNIKNNLLQGGYDLAKIPANMYTLRAQQLDKAQIFALWDLVRS